jgi:hypothetical protein
MAHEIFSIALADKETGEIGLIPSPALASKPRHVQFAELSNWLKMYEEEWRNIQTSTHSEIIMDNMGGSDMNIKAGEIKLAIMAIRKYMSDLLEKMHMQQYDRTMYTS